MYKIGNLFYIIFNFSLLSCQPLISQITKSNSDKSSFSVDSGADQKSLYFISLLMDRKMIYSLFVDIFGESAVNLSALKKIKADRSILGSPCSVYENFLDPQTNFKFKSHLSEDCQNVNSTDHLSAPLNPQGNILHQSLINEACHQLVNNEDTFLYLMKQLNQSESTQLPAPNSENIKKLLWLFYREKPIASKELESSIQSIIISKPGFYDWKEAVLTTCLSSHWQAL